MVDRSRELENALGTGVKRVEENESETVVLQRRAIRALDNIRAGTILKREHLTVLRPCPKDGLPPYQLDVCIGKRVRSNVSEGDYLKWSDLE